MKFLRRAVLYAPDDGAPSGGGADPTTADVAAVDTAPIDQAPASSDIPPVDDTTGQTVPLKALLETQRKYQETREQLAYLQGLQATAPAATPAPTVPVTPDGPPPEPRIEDFEDLDEFQAAERKHIIEVAKYEIRQEYKQGQSAAKQQEYREQTQRTFQERLTKAAELDPDLPILVQTFHLPGPNYIPLSGTMQDAISESDVGPQLLRYFANNKAEATRLSALNPTSALREVGRIEAAIINKPAPAVKHVTGAPEPIKPVGSGRAIDVDEDTIPMSEYMARERERKTALRQQSQRR